MKKIIICLLSVMALFTGLNAQIKIGDNPQNISQGSLLELESTSRALTLPRMTTVQMQAIPSPLNGMIIFNTDSNCIYLYKSNNVWASVNPSTTAAVTWPYQSSSGVIGTNGNGQGIVSLTGSGLLATGDYSHAEGKDAVAAGTYSWSSGFADTASGGASVAMGFQNKVTGAYGFTAGYQNVVAYQSGVALGQENRDSGWSSMTMGLRNKIYDGVSYSNILGYNNEIKDGSSNIILGESNIINGGQANTAAGSWNTVTGNYNSVFGRTNTILAGSHHIAAGNNNTIKSGLSSSIFGYNNVSDGFYMGAIGRENSVFFQSGVALGQGNKDSGYASITGGLANVVEKNVQYSASFGQNNISTRNLSLISSIPGAGTFSAGINNINSGNASIALGSFNRSSNLNSLAANYNSLANGYAMSSFGHYNDTIASIQGVSFEPEEILFSIGNGVNEGSRRNSFTMLRNGFTTINTTAQTGPNVPRAELDIKGTGAMIVPVGTIAERPLTPVAGMIRFCSDCPGGAVLQGFDGTNWVNL